MKHARLEVTLPDHIMFHREKENHIIYFESSENLTYLYN